MNLTKRYSGTIVVISNHRRGKMTLDIAPGNLSRWVGPLQMCLLTCKNGCGVSRILMPRESLGYPQKCEICRDPLCRSVPLLWDNDESDENDKEDVRPEPPLFRKRRREGPRSRRFIEK